MAKKKSARKPPSPEHNVTAPSVRAMAKATRAAKRKRQSSEDFNQFAARIRRETENK